MQYQIQVAFRDGRPEVLLQAKDERSAFDTYSFMSRMDGVRAVYMEGTGSEQAHQSSQQQQVDDGQQVPLEMRPPEHSAANDEQEQEQPPAQEDPAESGIPKWMRDMTAAAAALPAQPSHHQQQQPPVQPAAASRPIAAAAPPPPFIPSGGNIEPPQYDYRKSSMAAAPIAVQQSYVPQQQHQQQQQQSSSYQSTGGSNGKHPIDEYSSGLQLGIGEAKRFKRAVGTQIPPKLMEQPLHPRYQQQQQQQSQPLPSQQQPQYPPQHHQPLAVAFGMDSPGSQSMLRPFSKSDAEMITKSKQILENSLASPGGSHSPNEVASYILQRCVPSFAGVEWSSQPAYRDEFTRVVDTCQRILTGQQFQIQQSSSGQG
jgi:hypothetical protein